MDNTISQQHREAIKLSLQAGTFVLEEQLQKLADVGVEREKAMAIIGEIAKDYKTELFRKKLREHKGQEMQQGMFIVVLMVNMIGPVFDITSMLWYLVAFAASGIAGYFGYRSKPAAGVVAGLIFAGAFPFAYNFYFADRTSFIRIEMLIPVVMAALPAGAALFLLGAILPDSDD